MRPYLLIVHQGQEDLAEMTQVLTKQFPEFDVQGITLSEVRSAPLVAMNVAAEAVAVVSRQQYAEEIRCLIADYREVVGYPDPDTEVSP